MTSSHKRRRGTAIVETEAGIIVNFGIIGQKMKTYSRYCKNIN
jgi:hypothetical protein